MNVNIIKHALVDEKLTVLRNKDSDNDHFRNALNDLSLILIYESLREIHMGRKSIQTPLSPTNGWVLDNSPLIIPVVRAGLGMLDAAISLLPKSAVGFLGARRDEKTFEPEVYLNNNPKKLLGSDVLILGPMLATGGSLLHTLEIVHSAGAGNITVVCVIASQEGIANVSASQHSGNLYLAAVDEDLNENAFIVPGLGDAGDRQFGKM